MGPSSNTFFFPPQQAVPELAKCNNHTKSYLLTSRGLWAITHFVRKAHQAGRLHSYRHCPTKRGCLDNELQTVQDMAKACKFARKLAEASKVSVPQSDKVYPKRIKVWDKFFFGQCSYKLGRRANQAEEPHSYKQCRMKRGCLDTKDIDDLNKICSRLPKKQLWLPPKLIFIWTGQQAGPFETFLSLYNPFFQWKRFPLRIM